MNPSKEMLDFLATSITSELDIRESSDLAVSILAHAWECNRKDTTQYLMDAIHRRFNNEL
jgi:hypothetical protein